MKIFRKLSFLALGTCVLMSHCPVASMEQVKNEKSIQFDEGPKVVASFSDQLEALRKEFKNGLCKVEAEFDAQILNLQDQLTQQIKKNASLEFKLQQIEQQQVEDRSEFEKYEQSTDHTKCELNESISSAVEYLQGSIKELESSIDAIKIVGTKKMKLKFQDCPLSENESLQGSIAELDTRTNAIEQQMQAQQ